MVQSYLVTMQMWIEADSDEEALDMARHFAHKACERTNESRENLTHVYEPGEFLRVVGVTPGSLQDWIREQDG
jgi:hypothetical protein